VRFVLGDYPIETTLVVVLDFSYVMASLGWKVSPDHVVGTVIMARCTRGLVLAMADS
jgi:hypothetical protein